MRKKVRLRKDRVIIAISVLACIVGSLVFCGYLIGVNVSEHRELPVSSSPICSQDTLTVEENEESTTEPKELYFYNIPNEYVLTGGEFSKEVQEYTYSLCKDRGVDYNLVIALIEEESGYKSKASGDSGKSKGYMQVYKKWHKERMKKLGVTDLYDPYQNILVGVDFLEELFLKYEEPARVLMAYNMGESGATKLWDKGVFETEYSNRILTRAQEIQQDIQDQ